VLEDKVPGYNVSNKGKESENTYKPAQFVPSSPADPYAGSCNILLKKDDTGIYQMFTEEGEVFDDDCIVEFRYDLNVDEKTWRWKPLRLRYDKTARYKQGQSEYGNAYNVANSNWKSIHHPVTVAMISTGENIPDELDDLAGDDDVYYNRKSRSNATRGLRDFHNLYVKRKLILGVSKSGDTLIDYACGKGGDFPKWIDAGLKFVFGIDIAKDNLENRVDGACARYLNYKRDYKKVPDALFVNGNSAENLRNGRALLNDKAVHITRAIFGEGDKKKLGPAVERQYGVGEQGFGVSSCQFALHYFFENRDTFVGFMKNVAQNTKLGGYFIGTCYDGKQIFNLFRNKMRESGGKGDEGEEGEVINVAFYDKEKKVKLCELTKEYDHEEFPDSIESLGYQISVYQESINKTFPEYLVNFDYLETVMGQYGFKLLTREEAKDVGLPEGSGLFSELYHSMMNEINKNGGKRNMYGQNAYGKNMEYGQKTEYGRAATMSENEKAISFLNRYFVFKKILIVDVENVILENAVKSEKEAEKDVEKEKEEEKEGKKEGKKGEKEKKQRKPREPKEKKEPKEPKEVKKRAPKKLKETLKLDEE
jgi:hypothetical protein